MASDAQEQAQGLKGMAQPYIDKAKEIVKQVEPYYEQYVPEAIKMNVETGIQTAAKVSTGGYQFAKGKVSQSIEYGRVVIDGATTTITAHTPSRILKVVNDAMEQAKSLREDPVGTVKLVADDLKTKVEPYVPAIVLNYGGRTYEVVQHSAEYLRTNIKETLENPKGSLERNIGTLNNRVGGVSGSIVTRINGVAERVIEIPQVNAVVQQLKDLIAPVTNEAFPPSPSEYATLVPAVLNEPKNEDAAFPPPAK
ncbi:hypothetical protein SeLEV6574_g01896 [Synchytrium endobioticum]|nr:hypothetical protein SeLEV6574_g01896 [Synchytrium endobioticum]